MFNYWGSRPFGSSGTKSTREVKAAVNLHWGQSWNRGICRLFALVAVFVRALLIIVAAILYFGTNSGSKAETNRPTFWKYTPVMKMLCHTVAF